MCGLVGLSAILETKNPDMSYTLHKIWQDGVGGTTEDLGGYHLLAAMKETFPESQKWYGNHYIDKTWNALTPDGFATAQSLSLYWWNNGNDGDAVEEKIQNSLEQGHYPMVLVGIDKNGTLLEHSEHNHWVVVSAVSNTGIVKVYNPFQNRYEMHTWESFREIMHRDGEDVTGYGSMVEIWREDKNIVS